MQALVLGHSLDPGANAVAAALVQRGGWQVRRLDLPTLTAARWTHRLAADGSVTTAIDHNGIDIGAPEIVFNRLEPLTGLAFRGWSAADRGYGQAEWLALLISWLASLGNRVIGAPDGSNLNGPPDRPWPWLAAAAAAGLPPHPSGATSSLRVFPPPRSAQERPELMPLAAGAMPGDRPAGHTLPAADLCDVTIVGDAVFGAIDPGADVRAALLRLAAASNTLLLAVRLAQSPGDPRWRFVAANAAPVIEAGPPLVALIDLMAARAHRLAA